MSGKTVSKMRVEAQGDARKSSILTVCSMRCKSASTILEDAMVAARRALVYLRERVDQRHVVVVEGLALGAEPADVREVRQDGECKS